MLCLFLLTILAAMPCITAQGGIYPNATLAGSQWIFSQENNGPSTIDRQGGPLLVYNSVGVPAENITSVYPHVFPYPENALINAVGSQICGHNHLEQC